jgi:drug/metabolite transporter (DMT)-like permease
MTHSRLLGIVLLICAALLWSGNGVVVKGVVAPVFVIASMRAFFSGLTVAALGRKDLAFRLPGGVALSCGALAALNSIVFIAATKMTTAANAIMLQYTSPVWVALLAPRLIGEKTERGDWIFVAVIFSGMALFFLDSLSPAGAIGVGLGIFGGLIMACLTMVLRHADMPDKVSGVVCGNILLCALLPFFWGEFALSVQDVAALGLAGTCFLGLPWFLYTVASKHLTALEMVLITTLEPVCNPIWVYLILGETPGAWALIGGFVVLAGIIARSALPALRRAL